MDDTALMQSINLKWGGLIQQALTGPPQSDIPPAFLAALIANESGGNYAVTRFEPAVYARLKARHPDWMDERVRANATSWGLTQIMGINYPGEPDLLDEPRINLTFAVTMLNKFAARFGLNLRADFEQMFRCWNTGSPTGQTYDPSYVANGIARMQAYNALQT